MFRGKTASDGGRAADTELLVTDTAVVARPLTSDDDSLSVSVELADIVSLQCSGLLCRTVTLETSEDSYDIPTTHLDERAFRTAIVQQTGLENECSGAGFGTLGVCLCGTGTEVGCLLAVAGLALTLSVVGAFFGAVVGGAGLLVLAAVYGVHGVVKRQGANVWTDHQSRDGEMSAN